MRGLTKIAAFVLMLSLCTLSTEGQGADRSVFDAVPNARRAGLVERLRLVMDYQRARDWSHIYDLLKRPISLPDSPNASREEYVSLNRKLDSQGKFVLLEFTPEAVGFWGNETDGTAIILGCGKYQDGHRKVKYRSDAQLNLIGGEWYFSSIVEPSLGVDEGPFPCSKSSR